MTDYEEPSSDDPFAYDFLELDDDTSWITAKTRSRPKRPRLEPVRFLRLT